MPNTISPLLQITIQANGENNSTWGDIANANFSKLETAIAGALPISSTGGTTTLTADQARSAILSFTGTLTADHVVVVPAGVTRVWVVKNGQTLGGFSLKMKAGASGTPVTIPQGAAPVSVIYCDGADIFAIGLPESAIDTKIASAQRLFIGAVSGTPNALAITTASGFSIGVAGSLLVFVPTTDSTAAVTIAVNGGAAIPLYKAGPAGPMALAGGELQANQPTIAISDGANLVLINDVSPWVGAFSALASGATCDLGSIASRNILITGTTTITSFGASADLARPLYFIRFAAALTLTYNATTMILPTGADLAVQAGDTAIMEYGGAGAWLMRSFQRASGAPLVVQAVAASFSALKIDVTGDTSLTATADQIVLGTTLVNAFAATISTGTTGANGIDAGSLAPSTWYAVWAIYNPSTSTAAAMISASFSTPTMPVGFTQKRRIGAVFSDATSKLVRSMQIGAVARYKPTASFPPFPVIAQGAKTQWTAASIVNVVPPTAGLIAAGIFPFIANVGTAAISPNNLPTSISYAPICVNPGGNTSYPDNKSIQADLAIESSNIYLYSTVGATYFGCMGWTDNL